MGLVDYSDSDSDTEQVQQQQQPQAPAKKPFQKLLDRSSGTGKIVVNLPAVDASADAGADDHDGQPPAKRAKTTGSSRFSSFGSFLPPPKKTGAAGGSNKNQGSAPAPGVHLRTAAEPAFVRSSGSIGGGGDGSDGDANAAQNGDADADSTTAPAAASRMNLPPPSSAASSAGPSIPEGQKPEEEVKLVGKPLMFKPLSVARKKAPAKKKKDQPAAGAAAATTANGPAPSATAAQNDPPPPPPPKKKISLFSMGDDEGTSASASTTDAAAATTDSYEPLFTEPADTAQAHDDDGEAGGDESAVTSAYPTATQSQAHPPAPTAQNQQQQRPQDDPLADIAATLSPAARRDLFGRSSSSSSSSAAGRGGPQVVTFDMAREYAHNEALRASGQQQAYNPVRAMAPGKHTLRQVVSMAQSNKEALEESFARARSTKRDAAGRYGWR